MKLPSKPQKLASSIKAKLKAKYKELATDVKVAYANYVEVTGEGYTPLDRVLAKQNLTELRQEQQAVFNQLLELV